MPEEVERIKTVISKCLLKAERLLGEDVPEGVEAWLRAAKQGAQALQVLQPPPFIEPQIPAGGLHVLQGGRK